MRNAPIELAQKVAALCRRETYSDAPTRIEVVETHMSFVFLTTDYAYKLKKPVRYDFLDFSTRELRRRSCEEELRLNQRLAPGVYLGLVSLHLGPNGRMRLGGDGEIVEWLVQMRRLPQDRMLDERIRRGTLGDHEIMSWKRSTNAWRGSTEPWHRNRLRQPSIVRGSSKRSKSTVRHSRPMRPSSTPVAQ